MAEKEVQKRRSITVLWRIINLSLWDSDPPIESSEFSVQSLNNTKWQLMLYPRCKFRDGKNIVIALKRKDVFNYPIECECSILDPNGLPLFTGILPGQIIGQLFTTILPINPTQKDIFVNRKCSFLPNDTLTVRCRIWKSKEELDQNEHFSLMSQIRARGSPFDLPFKNFSSCELRQKVGYNLNSFCPNISLYLLLRGDDLLSSRVGFQITTPSHNHDSLLRFRVSVKGPSQKEMHSAEYKHTLKAQETLWGVPAFVSRQQLIDKKSVYLNNDELTLHCKVVHVCYTNRIIEMYYGVSDMCSSTKRNATTEVSCQTVELAGTPPEISREKRGVSNMCNETERIISTEAGCQTVEQSGDLPEISKETRDSDLSENFLCLYQDQTFSDFELRSNEVSFPVHKCVLSARSPVFRAMFSSGMKESDSNFLDVPDVDPHTLNRLLTFLYTGTVEPMPWEVAAKVYYAADKYDVSFLKQKCMSILQSNIAISSVCDILILADRHQDQELVSNVHDFILGDFDVIMQSKEWQIFMEKDPILAGTTTYQILTKRYHLSKQNEM